MKTLFTLLMIIGPQCYASIDFEDYSITEEVSWSPLKLKDTSTLRAAFEAPSKKSTFTIREFNGLKEKSLKKNVRAWLNDYKSYGFTITNKRPIKLNEKTYGYMIEALHKKSGKIFKQYMSINNEKLVTLTCHSSRIDSEFKTCIEAIWSFTWTE